MKNLKSQRIFDSREVKVTDSKSKKIGYFATLLVVLGSSIGSGIFFKSGSVMGNLQNNIAMSLISWVVAALTVMAMAIALVDVAAQSKKDDRGLLGWTKRFTGLFLYRSSKNIYCFFTLPIKFFGLPVYFFQSLQSALAFVGAHWVGSMTDGHVVLSQFGENVCNIQWWVILIVVFVLDVWFIVINGISLKVGINTNKIIMYVKFIPLAFALIIGFVVIGVNQHLPVDNHWWTDFKAPAVSYANNVVHPKTLAMFSPAIGLLLSLAAIFFAYDGFYVAAGVQKQMKEPKKISSALLFGLLSVTVIYLSVALSLTLGADGGKWQDISYFFCKHNVSWIYCVMALLVSFGILGIINGYSMWATRLYNTLIKDDEIIFSKWLKKIRDPWSGIVFILTFAIVIVITFTIIGALAFNIGKNTTVVGKYYLSSHVSNMYNFCNLVTNWQTIFTFTFIVLSIIASTDRKIKNKTQKKTKKIVAEIVAGIFSSTVIMLALAFQIIQPFVNLALMVTANNARPAGVAPAPIASNIALIAVLAFAASVCFIPSVFEWLNKKNRLVYKLENDLQTLTLKLENLKDKREDLIAKQTKMQPELQPTLVE
ncbi:APC family permease [Ureaplasma ceti]|uniref:APC family permease n=1 Tax=Ureaplasma ceti TaxID=3119530 RepID=A0ABP9U8T8_9BACT